MNTSDAYFDNNHMQDRNKAVVAEVNLVICDGSGDTESHLFFNSTGSSWRATGDVHDENLGLLIAYTRAVENLVTQMKTELRRRLRENDTEEQSAI